MRISGCEEEIFNRSNFSSVIFKFEDLYILETSLSPIYNNYLNSLIDMTVASR